MKVLNRLRYAEREVPVEPGQFARLAGGRQLLPAPGRGRCPGAAGRVVRHRQAEGHARAEIRGRPSKKRVSEQALEPELVTYLFDEDREKRRRVRFEELPDHLVKAVLAIEDRRFFSHPGLDPIRAAGRRASGTCAATAPSPTAAAPSPSSCARTSSCPRDERGFKSAERSYKRKAQEALLAFVLERRARSRRSSSST